MGGKGFQIRPEVQKLRDDDRNCAHTMKSRFSFTLFFPPKVSRLYLSVLQKGILICSAELSGVSPQINFIHDILIQFICCLFERCHCLLDFCLFYLIQILFSLTLQGKRRCQCQVLKTVPACTLGLNLLITHRRSEKKKTVNGKQHSNH